jgi:hypothetical protein
MSNTLSKNILDTLSVDDMDDIDVEVWRSSTDQLTVLSVYKSDDGAKFIIDVEEKKK